MLLPVQINPNTSVLFRVVVRVGATPPAHLIVENHVTVREPVPSCTRRIINACPVATFDTARVLFPASVTVWRFEVSISNVIVAPSESEVRGPETVLLVSLSVPVRVAAVPDIFVLAMAAEAEMLAFVILPLNSFTISLKLPLNCAAVGIVPSTKVVVRVTKPVVFASFQLCK